MLHNLINRYVGCKSAFSNTAVRLDHKTSRHKYNKGKLYNFGSNPERERLIMKHNLQ